MFRFYSRDVDLGINRDSAIFSFYIQGFRRIKKNTCGLYNKNAKRCIEFTNIGAQARKKSSFLLILFFFFFCRCVEQSRLALIKIYNAWASLFFRSQFSPYIILGAAKKKKKKKYKELEIYMQIASILLRMSRKRNYRAEFFACCRALFAYQTSWELKNMLL